MKVTIHGENYDVGCAREDEAKVLQLVDMINQRFVEPLMRQREMKKIGREQFMVMVAIQLADELQEMHKRLETCDDNETDKVHTISSFDFASPSLSFASEAPSLDIFENRFDRLEKLLLKLTERMAVSISS